MTKKANRLIHEKSPYLKAHAYNPVDWYPWSDEAFERAKNEDKPVFLSIGYSSCHWCHVMEKESFEDKEIAEILNNHFISIKVDKEERPDIDNVYMKICQLFTGRGGWPLSIFVDHSGEAFFADSYIPKEDFYGKMGLKRLLLKIAELWQKDRDRLKDISKEVTHTITKLYSEKTESELNARIIDDAFLELKSIYDEKYGGFGTAPKFPMPLNILYLFHYYDRTGNSYALNMALNTLKKMRLGGIFDQIGYGFHRYSTDKFWFLPHFEKMLYDNALLLACYVEAYSRTKNDFFKKVALEIYEFLKKDMGSEEGGFYSAIDADSDSKEGEYYTWTYDELADVFGKEDFDFLSRVYSLKKEGNFKEEATGHTTGKNLLFLYADEEKLAQDLGLSTKELKDKIEMLNKKLLQLRKLKVSPLRDEKVLTDWNALTIAALTKTAKIFKSEEILAAAENSMNFLIKNMFKNERIFHRYYHGDVAINGFIEDYAFTIWALIELYHYTFNGYYLNMSIKLTDIVIAGYWDNEGGGFFHTHKESSNLIVRGKEIVDNVTPSGNSVMAYNLIRLGRLTGRRDYEEFGRKIIDSFSASIRSYPSAHLLSIMAIDLHLSGTIDIVAAGKRKDKLIDAAKSISEKYGHLWYLNLITVDEESRKFMVKPMTLDDSDNNLFYLCESQSCYNPMSLDELKKLLDAKISK